MWSGNLKTAIASLRAAKTRSLLTMLGIIIGICSVVTMVSLGEGLKHQIVGKVGSLGDSVVTVRPGKLVRGSGNQSGLNLLAFFATSTLTTKDIDNIGHLKSVRQVVPFDFVTNSASAAGTQMDNVYVVGTTPGLPPLLNQKVAYGEFFRSSDQGQNFCVIGRNVADQLFGELNPVGQTLSIEGQQFIVHGVLAPTSGGILSVAQIDFGSSIFISMADAQSLSANRTNILQILAQARNPNNVDATITAINKTLRAAHPHQDFTVLREKQLLALAGNVVNSATGFISGVAAVSLLVAGIGIMDIMLVSVSERTREIGLRKAIGATDRQILNQFLIEGLALTIGGGIIGIVASILVNIGLRLYTNWQPVISWLTLAAAVAVSIIVGIVFSIAPALKAARKNPIDALRGL